MAETIKAGQSYRRGPGRRRWAAIAAILVLSFTAGGCDKFKSRQLARQGNAYFKEQMYEDALRKYEEAYKLDPNEVRLVKFLAMAHMALYNPGSTHAKDQEALDKAIKYFKEYLAAKPDDEKASKYLVTTYMNAARYDDAINYFKEWFTKHPTDAQAVQTLAMLYAKKGEFDQSMNWQKKRAQLEPDNAEIFYTMGVTCWEKSFHTPPDQLDGEKRKEIVDFGMAQLQKAHQLKTDYFEAMLYVNLMYRELAKLENDEAKKAELIASAEEWRKKALEARERSIKKDREEAAKKNPLEAM
ncbi:MAG: hypothetical protein DIJKHBIC_03255 [Thermoanaerobaculia bacterium]|nr:hypothetical protein [Thermoanaerobaculia bacterium]